MPDRVEAAFRGVVGRTRRALRKQAEIQWKPAVTATKAISQDRTKAKFLITAV
jgi:hypothetical protein